MKKFRELSHLWILALVLLVILLTGCLGTKPQATTAPQATATTGGQAKNPATAVAAVLKANTPQATEAASPTGQPADASKAAATPAPTKAPAAQSQAAAPTSTPTAVPPAAASSQTGESYEPIPGCPSSILHWGDVVHIAQQIEYVRIRSTADTHPADNIVRKLYRTELAKVIGNPVCNYGWLLWPVQTADGTRGWIPETDGTDVWLVRANPWGFPTPTIQSR